MILIKPPLHTSKYRMSSRLANMFVNSAKSQVKKGSNVEVMSTTVLSVCTLKAHTTALDFDNKCILLNNRFGLSYKYPTQLI